ncbi:MAG: flagellin [Jhaorihella sp.]
MTMTSIGDLAQGLMLRARGGELKTALAKLTGELSSRQTSDIAGRLGGDLSHLADIDRTLRQLDGFGVATRETALMAGAAQSGLGRLHDLAAGLATDLIGIGPSSLAASREHASVQARSGLESALGALNLRAGGRSLFAGAAPDRTPLGSSGTLLAGLKAAVSGLVTTEDIRAAARAWFDDPAGFRATMYAGSDLPLSPVRIGSAEVVSLNLRADDPVFRDMLRETALAALASDPDLGLDAAVQAGLLRGAGEGLIGTQDRLTALRADLGFAEARIEETAARNAAARTGLDYARGELLEADPYETAARLQEVQHRLESLYAVTARTARLSLLSYMK